VLMVAIRLIIKRQIYSKDYVTEDRTGV